jgi:hypothetical protein
MAYIAQKPQIQWVCLRGLRVKPAMTAKGRIAQKYEAKSASSPYSTGASSY